MGFMHGHWIADPELDDFYRRDADAEDKALAHAASRQPTTAAPSEGTAEAGPPPSPPQSPDATSLRDRAAYVADWLETADGPLKRRLLDLQTELRYQRRLDQYAEGTKE
jgi:hypothetical protein